MLRILAKGTLMDVLGPGPAARTRGLDDGQVGFGGSELRVCLTNGVSEAGKRGPMFFPF